jgi:hypothetical protein
VAAHCEELLGTPAFATAAAAVAREMAAQLSPLDVVADLEALGG